jgi:hypothetical protein
MMPVAPSALARYSASIGAQRARGSSKAKTSAMPAEKVTATGGRGHAIRWLAICWRVSSSNSHA